MNSQLTLKESFGCQVSALEARVDAKREYHGLKLWTPIFRGILERLRGRDKAVQQELMQLEDEVRSDTGSALARIEKIKGLLACVCLGLLTLSIFGLNNQQVMRCARVGARPVARCSVRGGRGKSKEGALIS